MSVAVATKSGIYVIGAEERVELADQSVDHLVVRHDLWWAIVNRTELWRKDAETWDRLGSLPQGLRAWCVLPIAEQTLIGCSEARLFAWDGHGLAPVASFDEAPDRSKWYTPWGGPPDVRSMASIGGRVYLNIHVGGILAGEDESWTATIDMDSDVHQVATSASRVLAATAYGVAVSDDDGRTWSTDSDPFHATYQRAVAVCDGATLVSASIGPRGGQGAIYQGQPGGDWHKCTVGLPEWLPGNIDTFWLAARADDAAFGTVEGDVYASDDSGETWDQIESRLPSIRSVVFI